MRLPFTMALDRGVELEVLKEQLAVADTPRGTRFKATVWREGANKNHVRLNPAELEPFAASFKGQPFLADHSRQLSDRGGTIVASELVDTEKGKAIRMTIAAVKPWAQDGVLDGTIDRFSIGWAAERYDCTVCEMDYFDEDHKHSIFDLGRKDKKSGKTVEVLMSGLEGSEVSAVTHPAVPGTSTDEIMSSLKVASESRSGMVSERNPKEGIMDFRSKVLVLLGLSADTDDAKVLALAEQRLASKPDSVPTVLLTALGLGADGTVDQATARAYALVPREELEAEREKNKGIHVEAILAKARGEGRITPAMEREWARQFAERTPEEAEKVFASMPVQVPSVNTPPPATVDPQTVAEEDDRLHETGLNADEWTAATNRIKKMKATGTYHVAKKEGGQ